MTSGRRLRKAAEGVGKSSVATANVCAPVPQATPAHTAFSHASATTVTHADSNTTHAKRVCGNSPRNRCEPSPSFAFLPRITCKTTIVPDAMPAVSNVAVGSSSTAPLSGSVMVTRAVGTPSFAANASASVATVVDDSSVTSKRVAFPRRPVMVSTCGAASDNSSGGAQTRRERVSRATVAGAASRSRGA